MNKYVTQSFFFFFNLLIEIMIIIIGLISFFIDKNCVKKYFFIKNFAWFNLFFFFPRDWQKVANSAVIWMLLIFTVIRYPESDALYFWKWLIMNIVLLIEWLHSSSGQVTVRAKQVKSFKNYIVIFSLFLKLWMKIPFWLIRNNLTF